MRILLIDPNEIYKGRNIQVGLTYIGTVLKNKGYKVKIVNSSSPFKEIIKFAPDIVGIRCDTVCYSKAIKIAKFAKENGSLVVMGGPHISLVGEKVLMDNGFLDFCIVGEGEYSLLHLIKNLERNKSFENIRGLVFRKNGKIVKNEPKLIENLDKLPFPDYSLSNAKIIKNYYLSTSRGCVYNCIFCCAPIMFTKNWRPRSPKNIINELILAKKKYKSEAFSIIDDNFSFNTERAKEICRLLISKNVNMKWHCISGIRADKFDEELAILMKNAGCESICFGIESSDPKVFSTLGKGEKLSQIKKSIKICKKIGIPVYGFFIVGLPNANFESEMKSLQFAKKMALDSALFCLASPFPRTKLYKFVSKNGKIIQEATDKKISYSYYLKPFFETKTFSYREIRKAYILCNLRSGSYFLDFNNNVFNNLKQIIELFSIILIYDYGRLPNYFFDLNKRLFKRIEARI